MTIMSTLRRAFARDFDPTVEAERERRLIAAEKRATQNEQAITSGARVMSNMAGMMQFMSMSERDNDEDR